MRPPAPTKDRGFDTKMKKKRERKREREREREREKGESKRIRKGRRMWDMPA